MIRQLTPRQLRVAKLIEEGFTNEEISDILDITPRTVRHHSDAIKLAFDLGKRSDIGAALRRNGLS